MKYIKEKDISQYNNEQNDISGSLHKKFVRIDNKFLKEYLSEALKPNTNYVSYIDDFVKENYINGKFPLKYVSVLLKDSRVLIENTKFGKNEYYNDDSVVREELCSKLANQLGIPTVYNKVVIMDNIKRTMSVDCLKPYDQIVEMKDVMCPHSGSPFVIWKQFIDDFLVEKIDCSQIGTKQKIMDAFVKQFIMKRHLVQDLDFFPRNVNFIHNTKNNEWSLFPLNDYEFCLRSYICAKDFISDCISDLTNIANVYFEPLQELMTEVNKFIDKDNLCANDKVTKLVERVTTNEYEKNKLSKQIGNNLRLTRACYDYCINRNVSLFNKNERKMLVEYLEEKNL